METPPRKPLKNAQLSNVQNQDVCSGTNFKVPASPFMKNLGYGTGVNVYVLERSPRSTGQLRSPWAIKRVSQRTRNTNKIKSELFDDRIVKEADILRQLNHPNIVGFRALSKENALALECCTTSLGTILEERLDNGDEKLSSIHIKKVLFDVARALDYLHTEAMLLHGDLKSHNILVKGDFEICKLCDFGVSLPLNKEGMIDFRDSPHLAYVGTDIWCAPEVIAEEEVIDTKADIFSFGLVIYEMVTLCPPHISNLDDEENLESEENEASNNDSQSDGGSLSMSLMETAYGTRPAIPQALDFDESYNIVMELFYICTNEKQTDRPTANIIWKSLEEYNNK